MRSKRTRHQPAQAKFVKRSYRGQVVLPELVMNHTESRHYYAWPVVAYLHNREPKIHMLVVPACNEFVRAEKKDWPGTDLLADDVTVSLFHVQYFQSGGNLQASETCDLVASNQHQIHPAGPVPENSEEDVNDIKVRAAQGRAIGVTWRLWARDAAIEKKDILKGRGYAWSPGEFGRPRFWYRDVADSDKAGEVAWLRANVMEPGQDIWALRITA